MEFLAFGKVRAFSRSSCSLPKQRVQPTFLLSVVQNCMGSIAIRLRISALGGRLDCLTVVNCKICLQLDLVAASLGFIDSPWLRCSDAAHQDMSDVCSRRGRD